MDTATSRDPPPEASGKLQLPEDLSGPRVSFVKPTEADFSQHPEEDGEEDREGIADPPVLDRTFARPQLGADASPSRDPLAEANGKEQRPADPSGPRVCFAQTIDFLCGSSGGCVRCAVTRSVQVAYDTDQYLARVQSSTTFGFLPT